MAEKTPFSKHCALVTFDDVEINPLKFVHGILTKLEELGVHLFPYTEVLDVFEENRRKS